MSTFLFTLIRVTDSIYLAGPRGPLIDSIFSSNFKSTLTRSNNTDITIKSAKTICLYADEFSTNGNEDVNSFQTYMTRFSINESIQTLADSLDIDLVKRYVFGNLGQKKAVGVIFEPASYGNNGNIIQGNKKGLSAKEGARDLDDDGNPDVLDFSRVNAAVSKITPFASNNIVAITESVMYSAVPPNEIFSVMSFARNAKDLNIVNSKSVDISSVFKRPTHEITEVGSTLKKHPDDTHIRSQQLDEQKRDLGALSSDPIGTNFQKSSKATINLNYSNGNQDAFVLTDKDGKDVKLDGMHAIKNVSNSDIELHSKLSKDMGKGNVIYDPKSDMYKLARPDDAELTKKEVDMLNEMTTNAVEDEKKGKVNQKYFLEVGSGKRPKMKDVEREIKEEDAKSSQANKKDQPNKASINDDKHATNSPSRDNSNCAGNSNKKGSNKGKLKSKKFNLPDASEIDKKDLADSKVDVNDTWK